MVECKRGHSNHILPIVRKNYDLFHFIRKIYNENGRGEDCYRFLERVAGVTFNLNPADSEYIVLLNKS